MIRILIDTNLPGAFALSFSFGALSIADTKHLLDESKSLIPETGF